MKYFGFVGGKDIPLLAAFCASRMDRPWVTMVVASYVRRDLVRPLFAFLPPVLQARAAIEALGRCSVPQERVEALEVDVRAFLSAR